MQPYSAVQQSVRLLGEYWRDRVRAMRRFADNLTVRQAESVMPKDWRARISTGRTDWGGVVNLAMTRAESGGEGFAESLLQHYSIPDYRLGEHRFASILPDFLFQASPMPDSMQLPGNRENPGSQGIGKTAPKSRSRIQPGRIDSVPANPPRISSVPGASGDTRKLVTLAGVGNRNSHRRRSPDAALPAAASSDEFEQLDSRIEESSHSILNHRLRNFLGSLLNIRVPNVKIYANPLADRLARNYHADALTYEDKILFRSGKYQPQQAQGLALLGHELTHAGISDAGLRNGGGPESAQAEEEVAMANEKKLLRHFSSHPNAAVDPMPSLSSSPQKTQRGRSISVPSQQPLRRVQDSAQRNMPVPQTAPTNRELNIEEPKTESQMTGSEPLSPMQLNQVLQFVRDTLRIDAERIGVR